MSNEVLNSLLKEYEQKKLKAELDLEDRKVALYNNYPRLQKIEDELNSFAIQTAKNILINNNNSLYDFNTKISVLKKEKENLLRTINLDLNYFKPFYECSTCNDTGYILTSDYKTEMCNCLKQKLLNISFNKSNMSNLDKENFSTFNDNLFSDEVDLSKFRLNISPRSNIKTIEKKCIEFVENFDNAKSNNLLFTGNTGLRKNFYV